MTRFFAPALAAIALTLLAVPAGAVELVETPFFAAAVKAGKLPPVDARVPQDPAVFRGDGKELTLGVQGGDLRMLMGRVKDVRMAVVYGYARLVGYDREFNLQPDLAAAIDVKEGRIFTIKLRKGHKWSDGAPFTAEDFRYYWEDIIGNKELTPSGPPRGLLVDGEAPKVDFIDETTIRYSWSKPNPYFLTALAAARPLYIYRPAHFLKKYHAKYVEAKKLAAMVKDSGQRNWVALHFKMDHQYKNENIEMPSLQPWVNTTKKPSERFIFKRNPFFHRIDAKGRQLPYIDRLIMTIANSKLIPAKTGSGEVDLQARYLQFNNYTFVKRGEKRNNYKVLRWRPAKGAKIALYPNLTIKDPVWRALFRTADFRRALSLAVNREDINQAVYFGLGSEGNNTVLAGSPFYKDDYRTRWATYDLDRAAKLLDGLGLTKRNDQGIRLLADGRALEIIVETAGEDSEQTDILELIKEDWLKIGVKMFVKPLQRENLRNRIFAGDTQMSVWFGMENAVPTADWAPDELAPTSQQQLQWSSWGNYYETSGAGGEKPDTELANKLLMLNDQWRDAKSKEKRAEIWRTMLDIHADQVYSIGIVAS
ncbi:MAG TPA: ABC transporter substrate-binding protein, partial [Rhodospirillales bacterium]|nr:ABC transporter substrate-binding protein [Rhodospirillales bacterium]